VTADSRINAFFQQTAADPDRLASFKAKRVERRSRVAVIDPGVVLWLEGEMAGVFQIGHFAGRGHDMAGTAAVK
jgi:hypothetical protein